MTKRQSGAALGLALLLAVSVVGCGPYWQDRGNDAKDAFEIGLTVSGKPGFALHQDYFNYIPHGFSYVPNGYFIGNVNRKLGVSRFDDYSWGYFARGWDQRRPGTFDPSDHHQFSPELLAKLKAEGKPLPTENPGWGTGACGVEPGQAPWPTYISCRRNLHLGFIGFYASMHPGDVLDFLLGWTTVDIMKDDYHSQAARKAAQ